MSVSITFSPSGMSEDEIKQYVMEQVFSGSEFRGITDSLKQVEQTHWGEPNSWYKQSGSKFDWRYATIRTEDWIRLHDMIGHDTDHANSETVDRVVESKEKGNMGEVPTPVFALEPEDFGSDPLVYTPVWEGRSRGVGAMEAGIERIPILVSVRRSRL